MVPDDQLLEARPPEEFRPEDEVANLALWAVARAGESVESVDAMLAFLRLPRKIQADLDRLPNRGSLNAFALANVDRVRQFYPDNRGATRRALDTFRRQGVSLLTTFRGAPKNDRVEYDLLFEVRTPEGAPWNESAVVCEQGPADIWREPELPLARLAAEVPRSE
ncbi:MAG TPA: hypothetical protein VFF67_10440 [Thermoplasmata archaeon]|nr:hypothetical protein [Thermoplasmata archaeon]